MTNYGIYTQCFIAGTMIETPDGKMAIEQIKTGDIVKHSILKLTKWKLQP